jgi:hypothetical protein
MLGHIAAVIIGFFMMVIGLGLGVTMIMLPVGLVIGRPASRWSWAGCRHWPRIARNRSRRTSRWR